MADEAKAASKGGGNWGIFFLKVFLVLLLIYLILVPGVNVLYNWGKTGGFSLLAKDFSPLTAWKNIQSSLKSVGEEVKTITKEETEEPKKPESAPPDKGIPEEPEKDLAPPKDQPKGSAEAPAAAACQNDKDCKDKSKLYCDRGKCKAYCGEGVSGCPKGEECEDNKCIPKSWASQNWWWMLLILLVVVGGIFGLKKWRNKGRPKGSASTPPPPPPGAPTASTTVSGTP